MKKTAICVAALAASLCTGSLRAHHSSSMFELSKPAWLQGTVISYEPVNPHVRFTIEVTNADGRVQRWAVEGPSLNGLERRGLPAEFLEAGDAIEVCGFALRDEARARVAEVYQRPYPQLFVHGHVLLMPNGEKHLWGSYGKLENCVRTQDSVQTWLDLVNGPGREAWCRGHASVNIASVAPPAVVAEIDRLMTYPCR
jgi:hypothetical protein